MDKFVVRKPRQEHSLITKESDDSQHSKYGSIEIDLESLPNFRLSF